METGLLSALREQRQYLLGYAIQKGLPFFLIPVLVSLFGKEPYASYVLFFSVVQLLALLVSAGTATTSVRFWFRDEDKASVVSAFFALFVVLHAGVGLAAVAPAALVFSGTIPAPPLALAAAAVALAAIYNLNFILSGFVRARNTPAPFLMAQAAGAAAAVFALLFPVGPDPFWSIVAIFAFNLLVQDTFMLWPLRGLVRARRVFGPDRRLVREVLSYSWPLIFYLGVSLFLYSTDKYVVRRFFPAEEFGSYVLSFQYAFAQMFLSQGFSLHTYPRICEHAAQGRRAEVFGLVSQYNRIYTVVCAVYIAGLTAVAGAVDIGVHPVMFPVIATGFLLLNVTTNYINVLYAADQTLKLTLAGLAASVVFLGVLGAGAVSGRMEFCYAAHLVHGCVVLVLMARLAARANLGAGAGSPAPAGG
jgi:O-antigen/teichoic acid export membrane protein